MGEFLRKDGLVLFAMELELERLLLLPFVELAKYPSQGGLHEDRDGDGAGQ